MLVFCAQTMLTTDALDPTDFLKGESSLAAPARRRARLAPSELTDRLHPSLFPRRERARRLWQHRRGQPPHAGASSPSTCWQGHLPAGQMVPTADASCPCRPCPTRPPRPPARSPSTSERGPPDGSLDDHCIDPRVPSCDPMRPLPFADPVAAARASAARLWRRRASVQPADRDLPGRPVAPPAGKKRRTSD